MWTSPLRAYFVVGAVTIMPREAGACGKMPRFFDRCPAARRDQTRADRSAGRRRVRTVLGARETAARHALRWGYRRGAHTARRPEALARHGIGGSATCRPEPSPGPEAHAERRARPCRSPPRTGTRQRSQRYGDRYALATWRRQSERGSPTVRASP